MKTQICTSIEQSQKLIEFGLDVNTADMGWNLFTDKSTRLLPINDWGLYRDGQHRIGFIPAWSLSALLELTPSVIEQEQDIYYQVTERDREGGSYNIMYKDPYTLSDEIGYLLYFTSHRNAVSAAFEMVCWLLENNYIKTDKQ